MGIHRKALTEYSQMSTHLPRFQSFFLGFCIILYWSNWFLQSAQRHICKSASRQLSQIVFALHREPHSSYSCVELRGDLRHSLKGLSAQCVTWMYKSLFFHPRTARTNYLKPCNDISCPCQSVALSLTVCSSPINTQYGQKQPDDFE